MPTDQNCTNPPFQSDLNVSSKDRFILSLNLPYGLRRQRQHDAFLDIESVQMKVHGAVVPAISIPSIDLGYMGQHANFTSFARPNYPPLNISFVVDNVYKNYYVLWKWLAFMNDPRTSMYSGKADSELTSVDRLELGNNTDYQTTFSIFALNEYNAVTMEFVYYNAFITNLGGITFSYRDGEIIESTAEFQYNQLDIRRPGIQTQLT